MVGGERSQNKARGWDPLSTLKLGARGKHQDTYVAFPLIPFRTGLAGMYVYNMTLWDDEIT